MNAAKLEKLLRTLLPYSLVILWLITLAIAVDNYKEHDEWAMGDWLINYHGGFVRRGLAGEIAIGLARLSSLDVGIIVIIIQLLCYGIFFVFSYLLLRKMYLLPYAMLIISPFIFTFQVNDYYGGHKKEIIYFALLSFLAWSKCSLRREVFERIFFTVLPFYALAVLSHEMLIFFLPYLLILYIIGSKPSRKQYCLLVLCLIPALISFIFSVYFKGTTDQVNVIFDVLGKMHYAIDRIEEGAIKWLDHSIQNGMEEVRVRLDGYIVSYLAATALALAAFLPIRDTLRALFTNKLVTALFLFSLAGTMLLIIVATDWGRFIYIHLVSLFILALVVDKVTQRREQSARVSTIPVLTVFLVVIWALTFHIPHYFALGTKEGNVISKHTEEINYLKLVMMREYREKLFQNEPMK